MSARTLSCIEVPVSSLRLSVMFMSLSFERPSSLPPCMETGRRTGASGHRGSGHNNYGPQLRNHGNYMSLGSQMFFRMSAHREFETSGLQDSGSLANGISIPLRLQICSFRTSRFGTSEFGTWNFGTSEIRELGGSGRGRVGFGFGISICMV